MDLNSSPTFTKLAFPGLLGLLFFLSVFIARLQLIGCNVLNDNRKSSINLSMPNLNKDIKKEVSIETGRERQLQTLLKYF